MAVKTKEEIINSIKERLGDDTSDEALAFLEDVTDTFGEYEKNSKEDWEKKYKENDEAWRKKYKDRFFSGDPIDTQEPIIEDDDDTPKKAKSFDELFKEEN